MTEHFFHHPKIAALTTIRHTDTTHLRIQNTIYLRLFLLHTIPEKV